MVSGSASEIKVKLKKKHLFDRKPLIMLAFIVAEICSTGNSSKISCEYIKGRHWGRSIGDVKSCKMQNTIAIDSNRVTISIKDESVIGLDFWGNKKIKFLPVQVNESFPNLLAYSAGHCSLSTIEKENFKGMNKLKGLWLYMNQISTINSDTFEDLVGLEMLYLRKEKNSKFSRI